jgi:hypothetical protein
MPDATVDRQLLHQPEKPSHRAHRFDPDDDRRRKGGVEFRRPPHRASTSSRPPRRCRDPASRSIADSRVNRTQSASSRPPSTRARRAWTPHSLRGSIRGRRRYDINVYAGDRERPPGAPTTGPDTELGPILWCFVITAMAAGAAFGSTAPTRGSTRSATEARSRTRAPDAKTAPC